MFFIGITFKNFDVFIKVYTLVVVILNKLLILEDLRCLTKVNFNIFKNSIHRSMKLKPYGYYFLP